MMYTIIRGFNEMLYVFGVIDHDEYVRRFERSIEMEEMEEIEE